MPANRLQILDAPSNLGLRPPAPNRLPGAYRAPAALRGRRLLERLDAVDAGSVPVPGYSAAPDLATGFRNGPGLQAFTEALADRTSDLIRGGYGRRLMVLGGDCSILLGNMLALRGLGRFGLAFIDGHDDFSPARHPPPGMITAAGRDLGLVTGHGPEALTNRRGLRPYVDMHDVVLFGFHRDPADAVDYDTDLLDGSPIRQLRIDHVRAVGVRAAAEETRRRLESQSLDGFWIHVDADVLDQTVMPAVDSPNPNGLTFDQLTEALQILWASPRATGLQLTIYDPDLDPQGIYGDQLADTIVGALSSR